ncbi:MAG: hypothetical protein SGJ20_06575 [Planctomycetota bacterium]|nr:hypothetical protein [Planctomycetota bacterium]
MDQRLVTLASFPTPEIAHLASAALEAEGIYSELTNSAVVGMDWSLGIATGGAKLQVYESDLQRAQDTLDALEAANNAAMDEIDVGQPEDAEESDDDDSSDDRQRSDEESTERATSELLDHWICPQCRAEVDEDDTHCWSCKAERPGLSNPYHPSQTLSPTNSARQPRVSLDPEIVDVSERQIDRAWIAAVIGFVGSMALIPMAGPGAMLCLACNIYSLFLLWTLDASLDDLSPRSKRKYYIATVANFAAIGLSVWIVRMFYTRG